MNLEQVLISLGISRRQAKVYLAALALGEGPVQDISRLAMLPRTTCYEVLQKLQERGLVSAYQKKKIRHFSAIDPHQLVEMARDRAELLEKALPSLMARYAESKTKPSVRYYLGTVGMKAVLNEVLAEADKLLAFSSAADLFDKLDDVFPAFVKKRVQKKIPVKVILRESAKARERQALGQRELREVRLISKDYEHHGSLFIWKNKVAMFTLVENELGALVVESDEVAAMHRAMFEVIWNSLGESRKTESRFV